MVCTVGLVGLGLFNASPWSLVAMALVSIGINASRPLFWSLVVVVSVTLLVSLSIYGSNGNFNLSG